MFLTDNPVDGDFCFHLFCRFGFFSPKKSETGKWAGADLHKWHFPHYFIMFVLKRGFGELKKIKFESGEPALGVHLGWAGEGVGLRWHWPEGPFGKQDLVLVPSHDVSAELPGMRGNTEFNNLGSLCIKKGPVQGIVESNPEALSGSWRKTFHSLKPEDPLFYFIPWFWATSRFQMEKIVGTGLSTTLGFPPETMTIRWSTYKCLLVRAICKFKMPAVGEPKLLITNKHLLFK